uniref:Uncharacterized protein n=1 Tax=Arundo donax TaxID=35708 RepID=A0A0A9EN48_ARUDO
MWNTVVNYSVGLYLAIYTDNVDFIKGFAQVAGRCAALLAVALLCSAGRCSAQLHWPLLRAPPQPLARALPQQLLATLPRAAACCCSAHHRNR